MSSVRLENANNFKIPVLDHIGTRAFVILIFLLQLVTIFQGFDLSDEGFLSTFYSRIFTDPESVSYCFMFWLTGIIGGTWAKISSPLGLIGIRLGGVLVNTATAFLTYQLLKKYLDRGYLKLGLILVILFLNNDIKVLNYNILSALFFLIIIYFLFSGLENKRLSNIFTGGVFVGLNVFIRTPNILELGLSLGIIYYNYLNPQAKGYLLKQLICFLIGFIAGIVLVLFAMQLMGHLQIFSDSMKLLFNLGKGVKREEVEGGYGLSRLFGLFFSNMVMSIKYVLIPFSIIFGCLLIQNQWANKIKLLKNLTFFALSAAFLVVITLIVAHRINHFTMLFFITGLILISALSIFTTTVSSDVKILFFFGCFFLLSFPLGSSDGIWTAGRYCLWIGLPIAIDYILHIQSTRLTLSFVIDKKEYPGVFWISDKQIATIKKALLVILIFAGLYHLYFYPFFDRRNRSDMHFALKSDKLRGVFTTKGRADMMNELFLESKKYIGENKTVIAYDNMAMYYYATNNIPGIPNPLPGVYSSVLFQKDINSVWERNHTLPPVVRQKIATAGEASKWPEETMPGNYFENERNKERNEVLDSFLKSNHYREVWSNKAFMILVPDEAYLPVK